MLNYTKNNIENGASIPHSVKVCLDNPRLKGLCGTISNLIEVDEGYEVAINTALGANENIIVTEKEQHAKEAIEFLKENKIPLLVIPYWDFEKTDSLVHDFLKTISV